MRIRKAFLELKVKRVAEITHPFYGDLSIPYSVTIGTVNAELWSANVPVTLETDVRVSVTRERP